MPVEGIDADELSAAAFVFKLHNSLDKRKQSVILPTTDILSGFPLGTPLTRKNLPPAHALRQISSAPVFGLRVGPLRDEPTPFYVP